VVGVEEIFADVDQESQGNRGDDEKREREDRGEGHRCCYPTAERVEGTKEAEVLMVLYTSAAHGSSDASSGFLSSSFFLFALGLTHSALVSSPYDHIAV